MYVMGFTVTLDPDLPKEQAEGMMRAVSVFQGVIKVHPVVAGRCTDEQRDSFQAELLRKLNELKK
jgi:hypothetical protein